MKLTRRISQLKPAVLYGLFNALVGLMVGFYVFISAIGDGYETIIIAAPIAVFSVGSLFWKFMMKNEEIRFDKVLILGILTGTISHYFTWLLISILLNVCYWCTGGCKDSFGNSPESILDMLGYGFIYSFFSLLFFGWITILGSVLSGLAVMWIVKRPESGE